ncbi:MAG: hypothetical protein L0Z47_09395 [Actinobacteria bacterium]|nr:hypothetical protein [Actinomycetota bacterium]
MLSACAEVTVPSSEATASNAATTTPAPVGDTQAGDTEAPDEESVAGCAFAQGEPLTREVSVPLSHLGESNGVRVEGALYPRPEYEGNPWSQWGQGLVLGDGRFLSAIGDHRGSDGNSFIYEYDPQSGRLTLLADVLSHTDHDPGTWGYGKVHGQLVSGPCGEVYFSTYWGTTSGLEFEGNYRGDLLFRLDPEAMTMSPLGVPIEFHGQASLASDPQSGLVYGESVDPIERARGNEVGPFFAYDVRQEEVVYRGPDSPHVGYRNMIVDQIGRAYYSIGDGRLAVYDPATSSISELDGRLPGEWLRASTLPGPDGRVFGVTVEPDSFFALSSDGSIEELGEATGYTTSLALAPGGEAFYYLSEAHGQAWRSGAPLMRVDTTTGRQETLVELNPLVERGLGHIVGGSYNLAVSADGDSVFIGVNASPPGDDSGFGEVILLVVHLP